jgi:hypothetical protein
MMCVELESDALSHLVGAFPLSPGTLKATS